MHNIVYNILFLKEILSEALTWLMRLVAHITLGGIRRGCAR